MKKILLLTSMILAAGAANAQTEYYASAKLGIGDTTIYVDGDTKFGDYLVQEFGPGYRFDDSGLLWEISTAVGVDWSPNSMYVKQNPYGWFHLRLEGEFGYNNYNEDGKLRHDYLIDAMTEIKYDHIFLLANGYADFKIDNVIPYIGFGFGYSFGREEATITDINNGEELSDSINDNGIIYALHAGIGYKYSDITTLDLGYRRVWMPTEEDGMNVFGTVRLGARFRI